MITRLYVGNLSYSTRDKDLNELFSRDLMVVSAQVIKDEISGRSKGFGFVRVETEDQKEADAIIRAYDGMKVDGRSIRVSNAMKRKDANRFTREAGPPKSRQKKENPVYREKKFQKRRKPSRHVKLRKENRKKGR